MIKEKNVVECIHKVPKGYSQNKRIKYKVLDNGCWLCTSHTKYKYSNGDRTTIKRLFYSHFVKKLDVDEVVWRTCETPECVNPEHMEVRVRHNYNNEGVIKWLK